MQRKKDALIPIEAAILGAAVELRKGGVEEFYSVELVGILEAAGFTSNLGPSTIARALNRLKERGFLSSRWEAQVVAEREGRPPRKYFAITAKGLAAFATAPRQVPARALWLAPGGAGL